MNEVAPLYRNLEQELFAVLRGASLECLVCGEFLLHGDGEIACRECGSTMPAMAGEELPVEVPRTADGSSC